MRNYNKNDEQNENKEILIEINKNTENKDENTNIKQNNEVNNEGIPEIKIDLL